MARSLFACLVLMLSFACGGGGGGSNSGGNPPLSVTLDTNSLSFNTFEGQTFAAQPIHATVSGGSGNIYIGVTSTLPNVFQIAIEISASNSAVATVGPTPGYAAPVGTQTGTLTFTLASDPQGANVLWRGTVNVKLTAFGLNTSALTLSGSQTSTSPLTSEIHLTPPDAGGLVVPTVLGAPWLQVGRTDSSTFTATVDVHGMGAGSFAGTIRLTTVGATMDLPVTLDVESGVLAPGAKTLTLGAQTGVSALTGSFGVAFRDGVTPDWTAVSDASWLTLGSASGTGPGTFTYTIDPSLINGGDPHWTASTANVTISATGLSPVVTQVQVVNDLPRVYRCLPCVIAPGSVAAINVYGQGFSKLGASPRFSLGAAGTFPATVVSDTQATVTPGPLTAGKYVLSPATVVNAVPMSADLVVRTATVFQAESAGHVGNSALFDPTRNAVFGVDQGAGNLGKLRRVLFDAVAGTWSQAYAPISNAYNGVGNIGMSPDYRTLYVATDDVVSGVYASYIQAFDPDTLQLIALYPLNSTSRFYQGQSAPEQAASATKDNRLWFPGLGGGCLFDMTTRTDLGAAASVPNFSTSVLSTVSGDGGTLLYGGNGNGSFFLNRYSVDQGQWTAGVAAWSGARLNGDGTRALIDGQSFLNVSAGFSLLGLATDGVSQYAGDGLMSWDGSRVYRPVCTRTETTGMVWFSITSIDVFDTTQPGIQTPVPYFTKVGSIPVPGGVSWNQDYTQTAMDLQLMISPLGDTLFVVGGGGLYVLPIPTPLLPKALPMVLRLVKPVQDHQ